MTKFIDSPGKPTGHFILDIFENGVLVEHFEEPNLVVVGYKQAHAKLIGGNGASQHISQIGFGTNGTAPADGNSTLTGPFMKAIDSVAYPATNQVQFNFSLTSSENNGMSILEFGLFTAAGALYARKVRTAALNKDTDVSISGSWIISF